jgi:hypothetical protein
MYKSLTTMKFSKKTVLTIVVLIFLGLAILLGRGNEVALGGPHATTTGQAYNIVGTRIGTTTTGVYKASLGASTTYPVWIGDHVDTVSIFVDIINASTTPNGTLNMALLASNDDNCETDASAELLRTTRQDVRWFDVGRNLKDLAGSLTQNLATTTLSWTVLQGQNDVLTLTDLVARCIAVEVDASSTEIQIQATTKSLTVF